MSDIESYIRQAELEDLRLSRHYWSAVAVATSKKVSDQINESYKYSPEYIVLENERKSIIEEFWLEFKKRVNPIDFAYFMKYISCQSNTYESSRELQKQEIKGMGITEKIFRLRVKNCQKTALKLLKKMKLSVDDFKANLTPEISNYITSATNSAGFPYEYYMNLPVNKQWQDKFGIQRGKVVNTCLIPEYLSDCGLCDCQCIICTDTNNCRRKDVYPSNDNTQTLKAHEEKIAKIAEKLAVYTATRDIKDYEREYLL